MTPWGIRLTQVNAEEPRWVINEQARRRPSNTKETPNGEEEGAADSPGQ